MSVPRLTVAGGMAKTAAMDHSPQNPGPQTLSTPTLSPETELLRRLFDVAVAASQPEARIPDFLPPPPKGRILVIGAGKASVGMARAVAAHYADFPRLSGLVITRHGQGAVLDRITVREAAHPVPDAAGLAATADLMALCQGLGAEDLVIALISGGASAMLVAPLPGLGLADKIALNRALLASGATIAEMNCLRRHLSQVKGGRLAALCAPAQVLALLVSDVPGDDPATIASGPCAADATSVADARAILGRLDLPAGDLSRIRAALDLPQAESLKPGDARLSGVTTHIVCSPQIALEAAATAAREAGFGAHILGDAIEGESRDLGVVMAGIARQVALRGQPFARPCVLLSGGETTVTLPAQTKDLGTGGRNVEFLLSYLIAARGFDSHALAADTDGVDGGAEVAGAFMTPSTFADAQARGIDPVAAMQRHDGHGFFAAVGQQLITGPTGTNVNDFRAVLIV